MRFGITTGHPIVTVETASATALSDAATDCTIIACFGA